MGNWLIILTALTVLAGVLGWLLHWYVLSAAWWPLVGREWRAWRLGVMSNEALSAESGYSGLRVDLPGPGTARGTHHPPEAGESSNGDEEWADQLHVIKFAARLEGPIAELTHYEVEYVAHTLMRVADWVPERLRTVA